MTRASTRKTRETRDDEEEEGRDETVERDRVDAREEREETNAKEEASEEDDDKGEDANAEEALSARLPDMTDEEILNEIKDMDRYAFDPKNVLLNRGQFNELLDLQTDAEPEFMQEIIDMYCVDSQGMLDELKEILSADECTDAEFDSARAALHKLRGSSSTLGAEGIQLTCESLRELCVNKDTLKLFTGPGSLEELETRLKELRTFLKNYIALSAECVKRKLPREGA